MNQKHLRSFDPRRAALAAAANSSLVPSWTVEAVQEKVLGQSPPNGSTSSFKAPQSSSDYLPHPITAPTSHSASKGAFVNKAEYVISGANAARRMAARFSSAMMPSSSSKRAHPQQSGPATPTADEQGPTRLLQSTTFTQGRHESSQRRRTGRQRCKPPSSRKTHGVAIRHRQRKLRRLHLHRRYSSSSTLSPLTVKVRRTGCRLSTSSHRARPLLSSLGADRSRPSATVTARLPSRQQRAARTTPPLLRLGLQLVLDASPSQATAEFHCALEIRCQLRS